MIMPKNNNVILKWEKKQETTNQFGLIIPNEQKRGDIAIVVGVHDKSELKIGDNVLFDKMKGSFMEIDGDALLVIKEDDIFAVVEV